jgi:hypothetical protein
VRRGVRTRTAPGPSFRLDNLYRRHTRNRARRVSLNRVVKRWTTQVKNSQRTLLNLTATTQSVRMQRCARTCGLEYRPLLLAQDGQIQAEQADVGGK